MKKPSAILLTGPMRSGTSMVAAVVHRLGWCLPPLLGPPMPPSWRMDLEDVDLYTKLAGDLPPSQEWWADYIANRREVSRLLGFEGAIQIKSPLLALVWDDVMAACPDAFTIRTFRHPEAVERSVDAHPQLDGHLRERIEESLAGIRTDHGVNYEAWTAWPREQVCGLANRLGVKDDEAIRAAAALIGNPTVYREKVEV